MTGLRSLTRRSTLVPGRSYSSTRQEGIPVQGGGTPVPGGG